MFFMYTSLQKKEAEDVIQKQAIAISRVDLAQCLNKGVVHQHILISRGVVMSF